jgi:hypothetical protein
MAVTLLGAQPASAYMLRVRTLSRASFGQYKSFYVVPNAAPARLVRLVVHNMEKLSYQRVHKPNQSQFMLRISERRKRMRVREPEPLPYYGYAYGPFWGGPFWGPPWWGYPCCGYGPGFGWGFYGYSGYPESYRLVTVRVRVIRMIAISTRRNIPVWRGTAIARIRGRTPLWTIVWHLVNRFPII